MVFTSSPRLHTVVNRGLRAGPAPCRTEPSLSVHYLPFLLKRENLSGWVGERVNESSTEREGQKKQRPGERPCSFHRGHVGEDREPIFTDRNTCMEVGRGERFYRPRMAEVEPGKTRGVY